MNATAWKETAFGKVFGEGAERALPDGGVSLAAWENGMRVAGPWASMGSTQEARQADTRVRMPGEKADRGGGRQQGVLMAQEVSGGRTESTGDQRMQGITRKRFSEPVLHCGQREAESTRAVRTS